MTAQDLKSLENTLGVSLFGLLCPVFVERKLALLLCVDYRYFVFVFFSFLFYLFFSYISSSSSSSSLQPRCTLLFADNLRQTRGQMNAPRCRLSSLRERLDG